MKQEQKDAEHSPSHKAVWPADDDAGCDRQGQSRAVPHFLCTAAARAEQNRLGAEPRKAQPANENEDVPAGHWMSGDALQDSPDKSEHHPDGTFVPLSPHLLDLISRHSEYNNHPSPPSWAQDHYQQNGRRLVRSLMVAGALVLASGVGLGIAALEFQERNAGFKAALSGFTASLWPWQSDAPDQLSEMQSTSKHAVQAAAAPVSTPAKQPDKISSIKLSVSDTHGAARSAIPLPVVAETADAGQRIALRLTGLPIDATLSAGSKLGDSAWLLSTSELADLHLTVPDSTVAPLTVTVEAIEVETGKLAAPSQEMIVRIDPQAVRIEPAAQPAANSRNFSAEALGANPAKTNQAGAIMLARGDETLALGDLTGARGFYQKALQMGEMTAARKIARTYDPVIHKAVGVHGLKADARLAERWYTQAIKAGDAEARADLARMTTHVAK